MVREKPVILVVGASSGLGNFTAMYLAKKGYRVFGTSRNPDAVLKRADEFFEYVKMDVLDMASIEECVQSIMKREGNIDVLLYCAGFWQIGSVEDSGKDEILSMFEVNCFGAVRTIQTVLKPMRDSGGGRILVVSGISGTVPLPFQGVFCASKAAIEAMLRVLRMETKDQGISVISIEPGDFVTMSPAGKRAVAKAYSRTSFYRDQFDNTVAIQAHDTLRGSLPISFAKTVLKAIEDEKPKIRYRSGSGFAFDLAPLLTRLPVKLTDFIIGKYYKIS